jgi:deoxyribose-phosphate aldolase
MTITISEQMKWLLGNIDRKFSLGEVDYSVNQIIENSQYLNQKEYLKLILSSIDLTILNSTDTIQQAEKLAIEVTGFNKKYPDLPNVAAICTYPNLTAVIRKNLLVPGVRVAAVAGGFPSSMTFPEVKELETRMAVQKGADEIDIVISLGEFLSGNYTEIIKEIDLLKTACGKASLKVILETGALKSYENIWKASWLAMQTGADFIKTSTGKLEPAATPQAAWIMCHAIKEYHQKTGRKVGFKAAGGISEPSEALKYVAIVKEVLGDEWLNIRLFRIGASRLANNILSAIQNKTISYF